LTADSYQDQSGDLYQYIGGPTDAGSGYFYGGFDTSNDSNGNPLAATAYQDIDLSSTASSIDTGDVTYGLSAWLGGYADQDDNAQITVQFRSWTGTVLGSALVGPVLEADRGDKKLTGAAFSQRERAQRHAGDSRAADHYSRGAIPGVASRRAKPGETILIYGIGFGAVTPNIAPGQIVGQSNQLVAPLQVMLGSTSATLQYWGLAPNFVGLYQFNGVVPNVANSDLAPVTFTLGGASGTQTLFIAVHN
jgi:hypothetical protein